MDSQRSRGLSRLEVCLACAALAIAVTLGAICAVLPRAMEADRRAKCSHNLKQVSIVSGAHVP